MKTAMLFMKTATVFIVSFWLITKYRSSVRKTKHQAFIQIIVYIYPTLTIKVTIMNIKRKSYKSAKLYKSFKHSILVNSPMKLTVKSNFFNDSQPGRKKFSRLKEAGMINMHGLKKDAKQGKSVFKQYVV